MERKNTREPRSGGEVSCEGASGGGSYESGGASIEGGCSGRADSIAVVGSREMKCTIYG